MHVDCVHVSHDPSECLIIYVCPSPIEWLILLIFLPSVDWIVNVVALGEVLYEIILTVSYVTAMRSSHNKKKSLYSGLDMSLRAQQ